MELNHLRVFFEVAQAASFSEAAKRLNISQSALSRSVALLEEAESVQLFERSKRGVALTPIGSEVFRHCEDVFQGVRRISEICRGLQEVPEGPMRFATTDHILHYLLPKVLRDFRAQYPRVIPSIAIGSPDEILEKIMSGECEFSLAFAKVAAPQIEFQELGEEDMALVVASDVWRTCTGASHAARLAKALEKVGYLASIGAHAKTRPSRVLRELFGGLPPVSLEVNGQDSQKQLCLAGAGVAYLSRFMVAAEIEEGHLQEINVEKAHSLKLWLAIRRGHSLSLPARIFLEGVKALRS